MSVIRAAIAAGALAGLSACASPPFGGSLAVPHDCLVVAPSGLAPDRNCTAFERAWLPGARRLTVGLRGAGDIRLVEIAGRHREITVRRIHEGYYCALAPGYPRLRVTRNCLATGPVHPPATVISARG